MTRKADPRTVRLPVPAGELPTFTPVPRQTSRHDGWTVERQHAFIEALADTGSVKAAAAAVDMSAEGAYYLRRQKGAQTDEPLGGERPLISVKGSGTALLRVDETIAIAAV